MGTERAGEAEGTPRDRARAQYRIGIEHAQASRYAEAVAEMKRAVEIDPSYAIAWRDMALARAFGGDQAGAVPDYDQALAADPGDAIAWLGRGEAKERSGDSRGALDDFSKAIELGGDLQPRIRASAFRGRANCRRDAGRLEDAIADFDRAVELDADNTVTFGLRGQALGEAGRWKAAADDYRRALELGSEEPEKLRRKLADAESKLPKGTPARETTRRQTTRDREPEAPRPASRAAHRTPGLLQRYGEWQPGCGAVGLLPVVLYAFWFVAFVLTFALAVELPRGKSIVSTAAFGAFICGLAPFKLSVIVGGAFMKSGKAVIVIWCLLSILAFCIILGADGAVKAIAKG